jgi:DNA invertase Pin-like site-specific DNA recombinase
MSTTKNMTMDVPEELFAQLQEHLATLQMVQNTDPMAPTPVMDVEDEVEGEFKVGIVKKVINHIINSETGEWSFNIMFSDNTLEWVDDSKCDCAQKIGEYMATRQLRTAHLFCRVSTKDQASSTSTSLKSQESEMRAAIGAAGRIRVHKLSESAYKRMPPKLEDIGNTAVAGDSIHVWRVDRLSRNICSTLSWVESMHDRGVNLFAHSEGLTYSDNKLAFIQGILDAQKEAALLGHRVSMSYKHKRDRGDDAVGNLPFGKKYHRIMTADGLSTVRKVVMDHPTELIILKRVKGSKGCPTLLARKLNMEGITKRGRKWSVSMVTAMRKAK